MSGRERSLPSAPTGAPSGRAPLLALGTALVAVGALLVDEARSLYFFGDDWAFLLTRLDRDTVLAPHNEHWSTAPFLTFRAMVHLVGIDHYLIWALVPIAAHLLAVTLLFAVLRNAGMPAWPTVIAALALLTMTAGSAENPLWVFQIGFLGSACFGLLALWIHCRAEPSPSRAAGSVITLVPVWLLLLLALASSGMALFFLVWLGLFVLLSRGLRAAAAATVPPALGYLCWYVGWGREAVGQAPAAGLGDILDFVWTGLTSLWRLGLEGWAGTLLGAVVYVGLVAVSIMGAPAVAGTRALVLARTGMVVVTLMYVVVGWSRAGYGAETAVAGRYAWFGVLFSAPSLALALVLGASSLRGRRIATPVVGLLIAAAIVAAGVQQTVAFAADRRANLGNLAERVLAAVEIVDAGTPVISGAVEPNFNPDLTTYALTRPWVRDALPQRRPSTEGMVETLIVLQTAVQRADPGLPPATPVLSSGVRGELDPASGCSSAVGNAKSYLELPGGSPGQILLLPRKPNLDLQVVAGDVVHRFRIHVGEERPTYVASIAAFPLRVLLGRGQVRVCAQS